VALIEFGLFSTDLLDQFTWDLLSWPVACERHAEFSAHLAGATSRLAVTADSTIGSIKYLDACQDRCNCT
jgi:hypothetical protein